MKLQAMFGSRIESRVAVPLIFAIAIPILMVSFLAVELIRHETVAYTKERLSREAQDYGMLVLERLAEEFREEVTAFVPYESGPGERPFLEIDANNRLTVQSGFYSKTVDLQALTPDVLDIADVRRCISTTAGRRCAVDRENEFARSWNLRLAGMFDTDERITVTVSQPRAVVLSGVNVVNKALPYVIGLIAILVGYGVMLYLRRRFRPVPVLQSAIREIEQGRFDYRVDVQTDDEFAQLGDALNSLSEKLGGAFGFREVIAQIDQNILAGYDPARIFEDICAAAVQFGGVRTALIVVPKSDNENNLIGIKESHRYKGSYEYHGDLAETAPEIDGLKDNRTFLITCDRKPWGWMVVDALPAADISRVDELARKASVAATSHHRSSELYDQATYDGLTGLFNRFAFAHELERMIAQNQRSDNSAGLVFLDLDKFKHINDTEGHTVGDQLLCLVAKRLMSCVREVDVVARLGGDEFAIALASIDDRHKLAALLRRIVDAINVPMKIAGSEHAITCSMGVCLIPQDGDDIETLLKNADMAMYKAKSIPGSSYVLFNTSFNEESERRAFVEGRLREAIRDGSLQVYLQPKLQIASNEINSFEALARWTDDKFGVVAPDEFIQVAERAGLIDELTDFVLAQVSRFLSAHPADVIHSIAINLSAVQLSSSGFVARFMEMLQSNHCDPSRIELEITESVFVSNPQRVKEQLLALQGHGLRISLDDYGTGFSSLDLITQLPLNALKIDRTFVQNIPANEKFTMVVSKIVEIARGLNLEVVAEGVEDSAQIHALAAMGCTHVQGYLVCKPVPVDELLEFLATRSQAADLIAI